MRKILLPTLAIMVLVIALARSEFAPSWLALTWQDRGRLTLATAEGPDASQLQSPRHDHAAMRAPPPSKQWVKARGLSGGEPFVAGNPLSDSLVRAWGTGKIPKPYSQNTGAFRFVCGGDGKLSRDDPLVYPGQPGRSHLHLVWGSAEFDAYTTPADLAAEPKSNCNLGKAALNRSSYWMPALQLIAGPYAGKVIRPDLISNYYKRPRSVSPQCTPGSGKTMGRCVALPDELRIVAGWDMRKPGKLAERMSWYCGSGNGQHYTNLDDLFAQGCTGNLIANVILPSCWDGKHLDSPDNRSHMAYPAYGSWGYPRCPASHPLVIPTTEYKVTWAVRPGMIARTVQGRARSNVRLSSDTMRPGGKPGETLHADYIEKWDRRAKAAWHAHCIEKGLDCSGGDLGNGWQLRGAAQPAYGWRHPSPVVNAPSG